MPDTDAPTTSHPRLFLCVELTWKVILAAMVYSHSPATVQLAAICIIGVVETGFLLGAHALTYYIQLAQIAARSPMTVATVSQIKDEVASTVTTVTAPAPSAATTTVT